MTESLEPRAVTPEVMPKQPTDPLVLVRMYRLEHASRHLGPCLGEKRCIACVGADVYIDAQRRLGDAAARS